MRYPAVPRVDVSLMYRRYGRFQNKVPGFAGFEISTKSKIHPYGHKWEITKSSARTLIWLSPFTKVFYIENHEQRQLCYKSDKTDSRGRLSLQLFVKCSRDRRCLVGVTALREQEYAYPKSFLRKYFLFAYFLFLLKRK